MGVRGGGGGGGGGGGAWAAGSGSSPWRARGPAKRAWRRLTDFPTAATPAGEVGVGGPVAAEEVLPANRRATQRPIEREVRPFGVPARAGIFRRFWLICAKPRKRIHCRADARKHIFVALLALRQKNGFCAARAAAIERHSKRLSRFGGKTRLVLMARARIVFRAKPRKTGIPACNSRSGSGPVTPAVPREKIRTTSPSRQTKTPKQYEWPQSA